MKKKVLAVALATVLSMGLLSGCGSSSNSSSEGDVIKIGAIAPLTGAVSTFGQSVKEGALLAVNEVNNAGGIDGKKVEFIFEDDQADQSAAINAFNKLVDKDKVTAIFGPITSGATLAVAPKATKSKIPLITPTATEPNITSAGGEYVFRGCYVDSYQGIALADFAAENQGYKTAAVLYNVGSDYSKGIADAFKEKFEAQGGKVIEFLTYNDGDKDFNAQLTKIKSANVDTLLLPDYYSATALIAKQARDIGIEAQFLGVDGWDSPELYNIGGEAVVGGMFINHYYQGDTDSVVKNFVDSYKKEYNKTPDALAALGYDGAKVLLQAIDDAGSTDKTAIKDALANVKVKGITGDISFGADRTAVKGAAILKVEGSDYSLVTKMNS